MGVATLSTPATAGTLTLEAALARTGEGALIVATGARQQPYTVQFANRSFLDATGLPHAEVVGRPLHALIAPWTEKAAAARVIEAFRCLSGFEETLAMRGGDGAPHALAVRGVPLPADGGKAQFLLLTGPAGAGQQIQRQKEAIEQILASVFTIVEQGLMLVNTQGQYVMVNRAAAAVFGRTIDQVIGHSLADFLPEEDRARALERNKLAFASGRTDQRRIRVLRPDGAVAHADIMTLVVTPGDGRRLRVVSIRSSDAGGGPNASLAMDFEQELRRRLSLATGGRLIVSGKLQLIGLESVRQRMGERWAGFAQRALETAAAVIRRRLGPGDVFAPTDDQGFVICFAHLSEAEAEFKARAMRQEIHERLVGELAEGDEARVSVQVASVEISEQESEDFSASLAELISTRLQQAREALEREAHEAMTRAFESQEAETDPVMTGAGEVACSIIRVPARHMEVLERAQLTLDDDGGFLRELDLLVLGLAASRVASATEPLMLVPVHYGTFASRRFTENYVKVCRTMSPLVRHRLLFELRASPVAAAQSHIADIVSLIGQFSRGVAIELPALDEAWIDWSRLQPKLLTVGPELMLPALERGPDRVVRLARGAHLHQARVLARAVPHGPAVAKLRAAGVDLVSHGAGR